MQLQGLPGRAQALPLSNLCRAHKPADRVRASIKHGLLSLFTHLHKPVLLILAMQRLGHRQRCASAQAQRDVRAQVTAASARDVQVEQQQQQADSPQQDTQQHQVIALRIFQGLQSPPQS